MSSDHSETLIFLDHAKERMQQRGITPQEVEEAFSNATVTAPGKLPGRVSLLGATAAGKQIRLVRLEHFPVIVSVVSLEGPGQ